MDEKDLYKAIGETDDHDLQQSEIKQKSKKPFIFIAAAAALAAVAAAFALPMALKKEAPAEEKSKEYGKTYIAAENAVVFPWEYMTETEKNAVVYLGGDMYVTRNEKTGEALLGAPLGECESKGYDVYNDKEYREKHETRKIKGVDEKLLIAVKFKDGYVVYRRYVSEQPATWGELSEKLSLDKNLVFGKYAFGEDSYRIDDKWYELTSDGYIKSVLAECKNAPCSVKSVGSPAGGRVTFSVTSGALGVYKKTFEVYDTGFIETNIMEYGYIFDIGKEAAEKIIKYAKEHGTETEREFYYKSVAGIIKEIGKDYVLIDDTVLCKNAADGEVYKVKTDDTRVRRGLEFPKKLSVGDAVMVEYKGTIDKNNTVTDPVGLREAAIYDGEAYVQE